MKILFGLLAAFLVLAPRVARAEEGMWTFDQFPAAKMRAELGWAPDAPWLNRARAAAARIEGGCSAAVVSAEGLVQTNHHCVVRCVQNLSTPGRDTVVTGFIARARVEERRCPAMSLQVLTDISDVTAEIAAATGKIGAAAFSKARDAEIAKLEDRCKARRADRACQVVNLYDGGQYKLYAYKRYVDVRLVFAPELDTAFFGGDPDNFNFPRYCLDVAFIRLYENDAPARTPNHYTMRTTPLAEGDVVLVAGNPGRTNRALTVAELAFERDHVLPWRLAMHAELRGRLLSYAAEGAEQMRIASDTLFTTENSFKARMGRRLALVDPAVFGQKQKEQGELLSAISANPQLAASVGAAPDEIAKAIETYRGFYQAYFFAEAAAGGGSELLTYARMIVRGAAERAKPDGDRLPAYTNANVPGVEAELLADTPVEAPLETILLTFWLSKTREYLTVDNALVRKMLGRESPEGLAARLVAGTKLGDLAERRRLWAGGADAVARSTDPLIVFVRAWDEDARAVRTRYQQEVEGVLAKAHERLAKARFALYGDKIYPDATFTLRLSYGRVAGWTEPSGEKVAPFTSFAGLSQRATGAPPYKLAPSWTKALPTLAPTTIFDVATTNDIIGGNSGSPLIDKEGRVAGAVFDGNIHSLGGDVFYDPRLNRTIAVASTAVREALRKVYGADALVAELSR